MTFSEFLAWLDGFKASFGSYGPDRDQWTAIEAKLKSVRMLTPTLPQVQPLWPTPQPKPLKAWYGKGTGDVIHDGDAYGGRFHPKDVDA